MLFLNYSWQNLAAIKNRIAFYGAGRNFISTIKKHPGVLDYVTCIIDNGCKNKVFQADNSQVIPIYTLDNFLEIYNAADFFIIISLGWKLLNEVYPVLQSDERLMEASFSLPVLMDEKEHYDFENRRRYPSTYKLRDEPLIPKKIHYCWFGYGKMQDNYNRYIESWKKFCPDYQIIRWDESNYDVGKNEFIKAAYNAGKWAYVSDFARLDIVYNEGGIYLDTDVELIKPLDDLLYQDAFFGTESGKYVATGLGFGAKAHCDFVGKLIDIYSGMTFDADNLMPCPTSQLPFFLKEGFIPSGGYQIVDGCTILPELCLSPKSQVTGIVHFIDQTFAIHHFDASWLDYDTNVQKIDMWNKYQAIINGSEINEFK